jgi:hypothetical protein
LSKPASMKNFWKRTDSTQSSTTHNSKNPDTERTDYSE